MEKSKSVSYEFTPILWRGNTTTSKMVIVTIGLSPVSSEYKIIKELDEEKYPNSENVNDSFDHYFDNAPSQYWFNGKVGRPMEIIIERLGGSYKTDDSACYQAVHFDLFPTPVYPDDEIFKNKSRLFEKAYDLLFHRIDRKLPRSVVCAITTKQVFDMLEYPSYDNKSEVKRSEFKISQNVKVAIYYKKWWLHELYAIETLTDKILSENEWGLIADCLSDNIPITHNGIKKHIESLGVSVTESTEEFSAFSEEQKFDFFIPELKTLVYTESRFKNDSIISELDPGIDVPKPLNAISFTIGSSHYFDNAINSLKEKFSPF